MLSGAVMILLLVVLGGLIAYIGDKVGMKVGKRRISIFGLRPKHSSIIVTIITGILIVSLTLATLLAISKQARTAFFGIQNLVKELHQRETELANLQEKYDREEAQLKESIRDSVVVLEKTRTELEESHAALRNKQDELDSVIGDINIKSLELGQLQEATDEMAKKVMQLNEERRVLEDTKTELEKQIEDLKKQYATMLSDAQKNVLHGDIIFRKDDPLQRIVIHKGIDPDQLKNMLTNVLNNIFRNAIEAGASVDEDSYELFEAQFQSIQEEIDKRGKDILLEIRSHTNVLSGEALHVSFNILDHVFTRGQVLTKEQALPGMTEDEARELLTRMLVRTSQIARSSGMIPDPETDRVGAISAQRFVDVIAELTELKEPAVVEVFSVDSVGIADRLDVDFRIK